MQDEITYIAVPERRGWFQFETSNTFDVVDIFPLTSPLLKYWGILHAHVALKIAYYFLVFPLMVLFCAVVDIVILIVRNIPLALKFSLVNLFTFVKWIAVEIWGLVGELVKAFLKKFLAVLGVFLAGYVIFLFFKTGSWVNILDILKQMFGGLF
jgi:hypothetical protein